MAGLLHFIDFPFLFSSLLFFLNFGLESCSLPKAIVRTSICSSTAFQSPNMPEVNSHIYLLILLPSDHVPFRLSIVHDAS